MVEFNFSNETGIWVRISHYEHSDPTMPKITLLPMIHIGEKEFFKEMSLEVWRHDTVFLEGCYMPGRKLFHIFHRSFAKFSNLNLQSGKMPLWTRWKREVKTQGKDGLSETIRKTGCDCGNCYYDKMRAIRADLHRWHALKAFKLMPFWFKLTCPFLILAAIIAAPFINLREQCFDDDDITFDENENEDSITKFLKPFWKFVIKDRDLFLRMVLAEEVLRPRHKGQSLCVKYGAKHMPALAQTFLKDFGYTLTSQREVLAVKKSKAMDVTNIETGYGYASEKYWEAYDAEREDVKQVVTELTEIDLLNTNEVKVRTDYNAKPVSFSIQTDLKASLNGISPAKA